MNSNAEIDTVLKRYIEVYREIEVDVDSKTVIYIVNQY